MYQIKALMSLIPLITIESIPFDVFVGISSRYAQYLGTPPLRVRINTRSDLLPQVALTCLLIASSRPDTCTNCLLNQKIPDIRWSSWRNSGRFCTENSLHRRNVTQESIPLGREPPACQPYVLWPTDVRWSFLSLNRSPVMATRCH